MIIKLDHISYSGKYSDAKSIFNKFIKYDIDFEEKDLLNIECKNELFNETQIKHDLYMMKCNNELPIEITLYANCTNDEPMLDVRDKKIFIKSNDPSATEKLFFDVGFKRKDDYVYLKPIMDNTEVKIYVEPSYSTYNRKLDNFGYSSLAFWSSNIDKDREKFHKLGYKVTDIEKLLVNGKILDIFFLNGNNGEILEFIGVDKNR